MNPVIDAIWEWKGVTFNVKGLANGDHEMVKVKYFYKFPTYRSYESYDKSNLVSTLHLLLILLFRNVMDHLLVNASIGPLPITAAAIKRYLLSFHSS